MADVATASPLQANLDALGPLTRAAVTAPGPVLPADAPGVDTAFDRLLARLGEGPEPPLVVVIGLGLGFLLDAIETRFPTTRVLAIEPVPAMVLAMLERRDWTPWLTSGRLTLLVGPRYSGASDAWRLIGKGSTLPPVVVAPSFERAFGAEVTGAKALAKQIVLGARANEEARRQFAGRYLLNTLANLPLICSEGDVSSLSRLFEGLPAVVVGAGPSLDRNIDALGRAANRAVIIAVDTALRPLMAAGIRPHLVVAVDPSEHNARHLKDLSDTQGTWLVAEGSLDPAVFPPFAWRTFTFKVSQHHPWPWLAHHECDRGTLRAWGSVLTTSFDLGCRLGCDPIVFAGADLAYTDGALYCRNTVYEPEWSHLSTAEDRREEFRAFLEERPHETTPDLHGAPVLTAPHFVQFRDWLVSESLGAGERRIMNATGAGILHGGAIVQADLASVLDDLESEDGQGSAMIAHEVRARLTAAWRRSADSRRRAQRHLELALDPKRGAAPTDAWLEFAGDATTPSQLRARLDATRQAVARLAPRSQADYMAMQRAYYDRRARSLEEARGLVHQDYEHASLQAAAHQTHLLLDFIQRTYGLGSEAGDILQAASRLPVGIRALDFGCGLGRAMEPLAAAGIRVDGVDVSRRMIGFARKNPALAGSRFFLGCGNDCGDAPSGAYDLVYSQLCLQHICSRTIRCQILDALARALRPGGVVYIQMHFYPDRTAASVPPPHAPWSADDFDASGTNGEADAWPTPDELHLVYADFARVFNDVRLQFVDFPRHARLFTDAQQSSFGHLIVSGSAGHSLAARLYAPIEKP